MPVTSALRTLHRLLMLAALSLLAMRPVHAQRPDMDDPAFAQAVTVVLTYDHFATRCAAGKGMSASDAAEVDRWRVVNSVELVRARIAELDGDPTQKRRVDQARAAVIQKFGTWSLFACRAAYQSTRRPEAQLAANAPQMIAALGMAVTSAPAATAAPAAAPVAAPVAAAVATPTPTPVAATVESAPAPRGAASTRPREPMLDQIESFGFDTRPKMGIGGFIALDIYPIVLFDNGELLTDVTGLAFPAGLDAHKRAHPDDWGRWRRTGGKLQLLKERAWETAEFQSTYQKLPDGFRLDGLFRNLSGTGNLAVGGNQEVAAWTDYRFFGDGRVVRGGGAGGRSEAGNASVATSSVAANRRGRYRVEGLTLKITYDDGSAESMILIADPKDPKTAIWLDGVGYVQRKP